MSIGADGVVERRTRGQAGASDELRAAIVRGELVPGQRLVESDLVEMLGVGRTSVRSAIRELAAEGLIQRVQHRGAQVRAVSRGEAVQILECRAAIEGLVAARAAERAGVDDIARLREHGQGLARAVREGDWAGYVGLNRQVHATIAQVAGQRTAADVIGRLNAQIAHRQLHLSLRPGRPQACLGEHLVIIEAVASGDPVAAERAMREHLANVIAAL